MLAERLKECRKRKAVTQKEVAEYLGMTVNAYQKYELSTQEPKYQVLIMLADYFNVTTDFLLGRYELPNG